MATIGFAHNVIFSFLFVDQKNNFRIFPLMPMGFADIRDEDVLTAKDIAERMGRPSWAALKAWLRRQGLIPPQRFLGSRVFRGRDVLRWFATLPSATSPHARCVGAGDHPNTNTTEWAAHPGPPSSPRSNIVPPDELERRRAALREA